MKENSAYNNQTMIRFIRNNGSVYIHKDSVIEYLETMADGESHMESIHDANLRLREAADKFRNLR